ncbi:MAG TPA: hypothetical protein PLC65_16700, partial [Bacteroidia bacterium]|nr:hypothetical protein [Bacteroidia bacterium]
MKKFLIILFFAFACNLVIAQKNKQPITDAMFEDLPKVLLTEINRFRKEKGLDTLEYSQMLSEAAASSVESFEGGGQPKVDPKKT